MSAPTEKALPEILIVDDDPGMVQALAKALRPLGRLRFATLGADALRLIAESRPDIVLLDAQMPGLSGFEVLDAIKADPALADLPVIMVTSPAEAEFEQAGLEKGAADFIAKPIHPAIVQARVRTQLRLKQANDALKAVAATDRLDMELVGPATASGAPSRRDLLHLLAGRTITELDPSVLAALATGGVLSGLSMSAADDFNAYDKRAGGASRADRQTLKDDANSYYNGSLACYIAGGLLAATGVALLVYDGMQDEAEPDAPATSLRVNAGWLGQQAWVGLEGRF